MELSQIYAPIQEDLNKVKDTLKSISRVDFTWLAQQLSHVVKETGKGIRPASGGAGVGGCGPGSVPKQGRRPGPGSRTHDLRRLLSCTSP